MLMKIKNSTGPNWEKIRTYFSLDTSLTHLGAFWLSSHPEPVRKSIENYRAELDKNPVFYLLDNEEVLENAVRKSIAEYIVADEDNIVLTGSTTEGLALFLAGWSLSSDDEILTTTHEHYSAFASVDYLAARTGATINRVTLYDNSEINEKEILSVFEQSITLNTRLIVITWVHSCSGVRIPIEKMCALVCAINDTRNSKDRIGICIDGTHGFGAIRINISELQCDLFVSSCHKWLNGPRGTGFVYVSNFGAKCIKEIVPCFSRLAIGRFMGKSGLEYEKIYNRLTPGGFHAFEHRWAIPEAIRFADSIGQSAIEQRILELAGYLKNELKQIESVRVITPIEANISAGIICFEIIGMKPESTIRQLRNQGIVASVSPYRVQYARFTPTYYNTESDLINALSAVKDIVKCK